MGATMPVSHSKKLTRRVYAFDTGLQRLQFGKSSSVNLLILALAAHQDAMIAANFLHHLAEAAVPYKIDNVLTDNGLLLNTLALNITSTIE